MPYGPPPAPAKRNGLKIGLIIGAVVLVLFCLCGVLVVIGLAQWGSDSNSTGSPLPGPNVTTEASESEDPGLGLELARGDCVVNDGTDNNPELRKVPCGPGSYEVLLKIPFSTDSSACQTLAPTADADYTHDSPLNSSDYVLCLKRR